MLFLSALVLIVAAHASLVSAQTPDGPTPTPQSARPIVYFPNGARPWDHVPTVTISGAVDDPRAALVSQSVEFWNQQLEAVGSPFRLGPVVQNGDIVPGDYLQQRSSAVLGGVPVPEIPASLRSIAGDVIVALSDQDFVSFTAGIGPPLRIVIGIRTDHTFPLNLPNVARNVIAHELGHAIGLGHNNDPTTLMCGRPATCRPTEFQSDVERFFPITDQEGDFLLRLYPPGWQPTP